jgi:hypothetical protein
MKSQPLYWIDRESLERSLRRAGAGPRRGAAVAWTALAEADPAAALSPPAASVAFQAPAEGLQARLAAFVDWVREQTGCRRLFVADTDGLVLVESHTDEVLIAISSSFLTLIERIHTCLEADRQGGLLVVGLQDGQLLHLVKATTPIGGFALGFVVPDPVGRARLARIRQALRATFEGELPEITTPASGAA